MANTTQKKIIQLPLELRLEIQSGLFRYGKVKVVGLGIFEVKTIEARRGRNPASGEIMLMPAYKKVKFKPTAALKKKIS